MLKEKKVRITNKTGLHAGPASEFVKKAELFNSKIKVIYENKEVNAKSIMELMGLGIGKDNDIIVRAEGEDAEAAVNDLVDFIKSKMPKDD